MLKPCVGVAALVLLLAGCTGSDDQSSSQRNESAFVQEARAKHSESLERLSDDQLVALGDEACRGSAAGTDDALQGLNEALARAGYRTELTNQVGPDINNAALNNLCNRQ